MDALPSFQTIQTGMLDYFSSRPQRMMKSFREIAMTIFKNINYEDEEFRLNIKINLEKLEMMKNIYHQKYMSEVTMNFNSEERQQKQLADTLNKLLAEFNGLKKEIFSFNQIFIGKFQEVEQFVSEALEDFKENSVGYLLNQYNRLEELKNEAPFFYHDTEKTLTFINFFEKSLGNKKILEIIDILINTSRELSQLKNLKNAILYYEEISINYDQEKNEDNLGQFFIKSKDISANLKVVDTLLNENVNKINSNISQLQKKIDEEITQLKKKLTKVPDYSKYVKNIQFLKAGILKKKELKIKYENVMNKRENLILKYGNLEMKDETHFTFAKDTIDNLDKKIYILDHNSELLDDDFQFDKNKNFLKMAGPIITKYKTEYDRLKHYNKKKRDLLSERLEYAKEITEKEEFLDQALGLIFAQIQTIEGDFKCFTKAQLSYIIFTMVKTNMIIHEEVFLESFFQNIPYILSKESIIFNYNRFTTESFILDEINIDDFIMGLETYKKSNQQKVISTYIKNWTFLINLYKEYTEFGTETENTKLRKIKIGHRLGKILGVTGKDLFILTKETAYNKYFGRFAKELLSMIPFLGNVPFLTSILTAILCLLVDFIIELIKKFAKYPVLAIQCFFKKIVPVFKSLFNSEMYDLNYLNYLGYDEEMDNNSKSKTAKITIDIEQVDTVYIKAIENEHQLNNIWDRLHLFDKKFKSISKEKIIKKKIRFDFEQLKEKNLLSEKTESIFFQELKKINDTLELKEQLLRQQSSFSEISSNSAKSQEFRLI